MLPGPLTVPPVMTIRPTSDGSSGSRTNARARLVSGPRATIVTSCGNCADLVADDLLGRQQVLALGDLERRLAEPVVAVEETALHRQADLGRRGLAQPRPARRVELLDDRLDVERRLLGRDIAADRRDGQHFDAGSNSARHTAIASSMPGSTSRITFRAMKSLVCCVCPMGYRCADCSVSRVVRQANPTRSTSCRATTFLQ